MTSNGDTPNSDTSGSRKRPFLVKLVVVFTAAVLALLVAGAVYNAQTNNGGPRTTSAWTATSSLPIFTFGATSVVYNGYLYEIGGCAAISCPTATVDYAPIKSNGTIGPWRATTSLPIANEAATSVVYNGYLYEIGGYNTHGGYSATVDYAPIKSNGTIGLWRATKALATPISYATSVAYNGYLYEIGGYTTADIATVNCAPINSNGTLGAWTTTTSLPTPTDNATSVVYNGYLYEIGGGNGSTAAAVVDYARINGNGTLSTWISTTSLPTATYNATSVVYNGYLYEIGGMAAGGALTVTVEYVPINSGGSIGTWISTTSLPVANDTATSVVYNGYLYEIGGYTVGAIATVDVSRLADSKSHSNTR